MDTSWWPLAAAVVVVIIAGLVLGFGVLLLIRVLDVRAAHRARARRSGVSR